MKPEGGTVAKERAAERASLPGRLGVELGVEHGWHRYVRDRGDTLAIDRFGASAPAEVLLEQYGFTVDHVVARAKDLLVVRHSA